jgi:hypothetical protein
MQGRILAGVGAWAIGATSATALCLLAVSSIDRDMAADRGPVLSGDDVARWLAETPSSTDAGAPSTTPAPNTTPSESAAGMATTQPSGTAPGSSASTVRAPNTTAGPTTSSVRVLTSPGGSVSARCEGSQAYLISWSPGQGYRVANAMRGPAKVVSVDFAGQTTTVSLRVRCSSNGIPTYWSGDDSGKTDN